MAEKQKDIYSLLDNLYDSCIDHAKNDLKQITELAKKLDGIEKIKSWDIPYYSEKLKKELFDYDENSLKPYFKSEMLLRCFCCNKTLWATIQKLDTVQTWHEDVNVYEVLDEDDSMSDYCTKIFS